MSQLINQHSFGLTIFRVLICLIIIKNLCFYLPLSEYFFGANAISQYESYIEQMNFYGMRYLTYPFNIPYLTKLYLILMIILTSMYMLAIGGRFVGIIVFLGIIVLKIRNGFILDGSDNVIQVVFPFLVLADNLQHFRYFKLGGGKTGNLFFEISVVATYALMIQVCFVYLFTGLAKHQGELWQNGTAIYYTMRVRDFMATNWNIPLTENHYFVVLSTYFTMLLELAFPFLIWFKKTKYYIMIGGVLLHVGIWIFMRIDNFSWVMISTYFIFIANSEYKYVLQNIKDHRLTKFICN